MPPPAQVRPRLQLNLTAPFHVFLQHKALSDRRRDDAIPEPLGQLSQRPPAGAVRRGDQLEVEGLERVGGLQNDRLVRAARWKPPKTPKRGMLGNCSAACVRTLIRAAC